MQKTNTPVSMPIPFAASAPGADIAIPPTTSQIGIFAGAASLPDGFPPLTFADPATGGVAPRGKDFNGILNMLSQGNVWEQAGGQAVYNATFQTAIGGYPQGAVIQRTDLTGWWLSLVDNNLANPETGGAGWVSFGSTDAPVTITLAAANVTPTSLQAARGILVFSGALTANVQVILPTWSGKKWLLLNSCTGAFTVTAITASGTGVVVPLTPLEVYCDGTSVISASQPIYSDLASSATGKGAALVGAIAAGVGAVARTAQAKLRDLFSTADYDTLADAKTAAANTTLLDPTQGKFWLLHGGAPTFDEASGALGRILAFDNQGQQPATPASANLAYIRASQTDGSANAYTIGASGIVAGYECYLAALSGSSPSSNAYQVIGSVQNFGPGTVKGLYGRAIMMSGSTGIGIAGVSRTEVQTGSTPSSAIAHQFGHAGNTTIPLYSVLQFDTEAASGKSQYGIVSLNTMTYTTAFIRAVAGGGGKFLQWQASGGGADLFSVADAGDLYTATKLTVGSGATVLTDGSLTRSVTGGNMQISSGSTGTLYLGVGSSFPLTIAGSVISVDNASGKRLNFTGAGSTTVGAAGTASALPSAPLGYVITQVNGSDVKLPYYNI